MIFRYIHNLGNLPSPNKHFHYKNWKVYSHHDLPFFFCKDGVRFITLVTLLSVTQNRVEGLTTCLLSIRYTLYLYLIPVHTTKCGY